MSTTASSLTLHRIETKGRFVLLVIAVPAALALLGLWAYLEMHAGVLQSTPKAMRLSPGLREFVTDLDPVGFALLSTTDLLYKPYFSIGLMLAGLVAWRVVGVPAADGIHKYFLVGGCSRDRTALTAGIVLAWLVVELAVATLLVNLLAGFVGFGAASGSISAGEAALAVGLYLAAALPLLNFALLIAILARLHVPRIPLLVAALLLPIAFGLLDTVTPSKHVSPWGSLALLDVVPHMSTAFLVSMGVEALWLAVLSGLFWLSSVREQVSV